MQRKKNVLICTAAHPGIGELVNHAAEENVLICTAAHPGIGKLVNHAAKEKCSHLYGCAFGHRQVVQ